MDVGEREPRVEKEIRANSPEFISNGEIRPVGSHRSAPLSIPPRKNYNVLSENQPYPRLSLSHLLTHPPSNIPPHPTVLSQDSSPDSFGTADVALRHSTT